MQESKKGSIESKPCRVLTAFTLVASTAACSGPATDDTSGDLGETEIATTSEALGTEDGLAEAYNFFKTRFEVGFDFNGEFELGCGFHPGLSTEQLKAFGTTASSKVVLDFDEGKIRATLNAVPNSGEFDLWLVKNKPGSGTFRPESFDDMRKVGPFGNRDTLRRSRSLERTTSLVNFDLDMVIVTRKGKNPTESRICVGERTLFEKRFFRERAGLPMDPVIGARSTAVETTDPLVQRGAQLFFAETFGGNGRTCATCHRAERNFTIDAEFIATLPQSDPLFVAENNPALAELEDSVALREEALFIENVDGLDDPTNKFTLRSANHTFGLATTLDFGSSPAFEWPVMPPRQRLGWGGDGSPGGGTLHQFAFGAIIQHFPKRLNRAPGVDFRIPTQEELDALEAFQLFLGRQKMPDVTVIQFRDADANAGKALSAFQSKGKCANCHFELQPFGINLNENFEIGTHDRTPELPPDDGFLGPVNTPFTIEPPIANVALPGQQLFNIPPLIEAADTGPFFHNNSAETIEDSIEHYSSPFFNESEAAKDPLEPGATGPTRVGPIDLTPEEIALIGVFLRELNVAENLRQIRKRVVFVRDHRASGNTALLRATIADAADALRMLSEKNLNPAARHAIATAKQTLEIARANADANRPPFMDNALAWIDVARDEILSVNPNNDF